MSLLPYRYSMDKVQAVCKATEMFGSEVHELKLGRSFYQNKSGAFHTIRYDFKPASIDHSKSASLEVKEGSEVNISFPNDESKGGPSSTNFKGPLKPCQKDCVLIYDHRSGEFTLEKLTSNINVKIQRLEGSSRVKPPSKPTSGKPISHPNKKSSNARMKSPQKREMEGSRIEKEAPSRDTHPQRSLPPSTQRPPTPEVFTRTLSEESSPEAPTVTQNATHKLSQDSSEDEQLSGSASSSEEDEDESSSNNSSSEEEDSVQASNPKKAKYEAPPAANKPRRESAQILNQLQHDLSLSESESDDGD